jgi:hypothetical protein
MKQDKVFEAAFFKPRTADSCGPIPATERVTAPSKTRAITWAKDIARERGWRFLELREVQGAPNQG